jgi:hypothetical protein
LNYFQGSESKLVLPDLCSISLFASLIKIRPTLQSGQGVHPSDVQDLSQHPADMHKQYPTNEEDVGFSKVSIAKQLPEFSQELNTAKLGILPQLHLSWNLDKECSIVLYNPCATIFLTCTS